MVPDLWKWLFLNHPYRIKNNILCWIATDNNQIVGQIGASPVLLKVNDRLHMANWGADLVVLPEYRKRGIAKGLLKEKNSSEKITLGGQMGDITRHIRLSVGDEIAQPASVFSKTLYMTAKATRSFIAQSLQKKRPYAFAASLLNKSNSLRRILTFFLNNRLRQKTIRVNPIESTPYTFRNVEIFDESVNILWKQLSSQFEASVVRDRKYLNWKFSLKPNVQYLKYYFYFYETLIGYVVLRRQNREEGNDGLIIDFLINRRNENHLRTLFRFAEYELCKTKPEGLMCITSIPEFQNALISQGYTLTRKIYPMISISDEDLSPIKETLLNSFHLTYGDHDWDQYRPWHRQDN